MYIVKEQQKEEIEMIEVRFNGEIDSLTVLVIDRDEKTFVITDLENLEKYADVESDEVNPYLENGEDVWVQDINEYVDYLTDQGYKDLEEE